MSPPDQVMPGEERRGEKSASDVPRRKKGLET